MFKSNEARTNYHELARVPRAVKLPRASWIQILTEQYGDELRGLSLQELSQLPPTKWVQAPTKKQSTKHPGDPDFSFADLPDFFDGQGYLQSLVAQCDGDIVRASTLIREAIDIQLPSATPTKYGQITITPEGSSPAERIDNMRLSYEFTSRAVAYFPLDR